MDKRKTPRIVVQIPITFSSSPAQTVGKGTLRNLSLTGCAVRSEMRVEKGALLALRIYPPDCASPIVVEDAAVRWVEGLDFGLEFLKVQPDQQERLREAVTIRENSGFFRRSRSYAGEMADRINPELEDVTCPRCRKNFVKRTRREGFVERLLGQLYIYPFRCQLCAHRFRSMRWGVRYHCMPVDRRQYVRLPVRFPASFSSDQGEGTGVVTQLSIDGCTVEAATSVFAGALLCVRLEIPGQEPEITVETAVVRTVLHQRNWVGLEFLRLASAEKDRLTQFVLSLWMARQQTSDRGAPSVTS